MHEKKKDDLEIESNKQSQTASDNSEGKAKEIIEKLKDNVWNEMIPNSFNDAEQKRCKADASKLVTEIKVLDIRGIEFNEKYSKGYFHKNKDLD